MSILNVSNVLYHKLNNVFRHLDFSKVLKCVIRFVGIITLTLHFAEDIFDPKPKLYSTHFSSAYRILLILSSNKLKTR